nr:putative sulfate exporter family transporter [uncultured Carboxylicivirga sp.]
MTNLKKHSQYLFLLFIILCFTPMMSPALALIAGITLSAIGIKQENITKYTSQVLQYSIVLMGFGMSLSEVIKASKSGFFETAISVVVVMTSGILLGRLFKVKNNIALLISAGTAICGGSAIAAISPVLNSEKNESSMALIVVFILNAVALLIFPFIGHYFDMSQEVFGNWAAIAIHDTSSVTGAGAAYGPEALQIATTVKLIRALWIIPLSIVIALFNKKEGGRKISFPWFILLFALAIAIANLFPGMSETYTHLNWLGRRGIVVALFLIGSGFSMQSIKQSGSRSFILGITLWLIIGVGSFLILTS